MAIFGDMHKIQIKYIILFFIYVFLLFFLNSCKTITKIETETEYIHDTLRIEKVQYDSIYLGDKTIIETRNDTVYNTRYVTKYKEKIKWKDSIQVQIQYKDKEIVKEIVKKEKWYKQFSFWLSVLLGLLLIFSMKLRK